MKNLYIVRGLPGSGKSTFARSIAKPYQIFEADQYFMKKGKYNFDETNALFDKFRKTNKNKITLKKGTKRIHKNRLINKLLTHVNN